MLFLDVDRIWRPGNSSSTCGSVWWERYGRGCFIAPSRQPLDWGCQAWVTCDHRSGETKYLQSDEGSTGVLQPWLSSSTGSWTRDLEAGGSEGTAQQIHLLGCWYVKSNNLIPTSITIHISWSKIDASLLSVDLVNICWLV